MRLSPRVSPRPATTVAPSRHRRAGAFTLVEVMVASTVLIFEVRNSGFSRGSHATSSSTRSSPASPADGLREAVSRFASIRNASL